MPCGKITKVSPHAKFLTIGQAVLLTGLGYATIRSAYRDGRIPNAPLPGSVLRVRLARRDDVLNFVRQLELALDGADGAGLGVRP